ncbi:MAG: hypothetical protein KBT12_00910 [Bacteroidales bacterium]|nr:hypothetical protein [Candidatus Physcousia equi]
MKNKFFLLLALLMMGVVGVRAIEDHKVYTIKGAFAGPSYRPIYYNAEAKRFKSADGENGADPQKFVLLSSPYTNNAGLETFKVGRVEGDGFIHYDPSGNDKVAKANAASIAFPTSSTTLTSPVTFENNGVAEGYYGMVGLGGANTYRSYVVQNNTNINYNTRVNNNKVYASNSLGATNTWQSNFLIEEVEGYDVYDIVLVNALEGVTISYTGDSECLTTTPQTDGGYIVLASGAQKTTADFGNTPATITVNESAHTITFDYPVSTNITLKFTNNLGQIISVEAPAYLNQSAESFIPSVPFFNATGVAETNKIITDDNKSFTVTGSWNLPFVLGNVYYLRDRLQNNGTPQYYAKSDGTNAPSHEITPSFDKSFLWSFEAVPNTLNQFYLKNMLSGYTNTNANAASTFSTESGTAMELYEYIGTYHNTGKDFGFAIPDGTNSVYGDHQGSKLGYWSNGNNTRDAKMKNEGSAFQVEEVDFEDIRTEPVYPSFLTGGETSFYYDAEKTSIAAASPTTENVEAVFASVTEYTIPAKNLDPSKYYVLKNQNRNTSCYVTANTFAIKDGSITGDNNPRQMITNATAADAASLWQFVQSGNGYKIKHVNSGLCLYNGTTNNQGIDMPISEQYAGTYIPENVEGKWWRIRREGQDLWVHQGNEGWQWRTLLYNAEPSMTNCQASLWSLEEVTTLPVTVSAALYASVCFPVDIEIPEGVDAYYATATSEGKMTLKKIDGAIPARTGVVLKAEEAKTYDFPITTGAGNIEDNLLKGSTITRKGFTEDGFYALGNKEGIGFYLNGSGTTAVPANKAYMESSASTSGVRMEFSFADDNLETSIQELLETEMTKGASIYDLSGRKLNGLQKGINIVNGKKVIR